MWADMKKIISAAKQGNASSQYDLGVYYYRGQGVKKSYRDAVKWYTLAAEQRHSTAQEVLGSMYYAGTGVIQDFAIAHMWFNISASQGNDIGKRKLDTIAEEMTPTQIAEAQKLARECVKKNYKGC